MAMHVIDRMAAQPIVFLGEMPEKTDSLLHRSIIDKAVRTDALSMFDHHEPP